MVKRKIVSYLVPALLAVLIFASDFLSTEIFKFGENNFAVWFVLSLFCFACGWLINKSFGWTIGGKIVFALTISTAFVSVIFVALFREYFSATNLVVENILLFILRNITLGAMGFFGMAITEIFTLQRELLSTSGQLKVFKETVGDAKNEAQLTLKDAEIKARHLLGDAELTAKNIMIKKERIEKELREFVQIEKELIKKYEEQG
jgi:hypothetical protein